MLNFVNKTQAAPVLPPTTPSPPKTPKNISSRSGGGEPPERSKLVGSYDSDDRPRKRGRRRIKADELASIRIETRVHPSEFLGFKKRCDQGGVTVSVAIREFVRTGTFIVAAPPPAVDWSGATEGVQRDLRACGINLNQIARVLNSASPSGNVSAMALAWVRQGVDSALTVLQSLMPVVSVTSRPPPSVVAQPNPVSVPKSRKWLDWVIFKKGA